MGVVLNRFVLGRIAFAPIPKPVDLKAWIGYAAEPLARLLAGGPVHQLPETDDASQ